MIGSHNNSGSRALLSPVIISVLKHSTGGTIRNSRFIVASQS
jgi:hypothetical protein